MEVLGIDIGGSGVKGAPVNIKTGDLLAERYRIPTPQPATPQAVAEVISQIARKFSWSEPVGCGYPGVVQRGVTRTAANVDKSWIGTDAASLISEATGCPTAVINDADAAGLAEMTFGAGKGVKGTVMLVTLGTGIGTAVFIDGVLLPNTELGHIQMGKTTAEHYAADSVRENKKLKWKAWADRLDEVFALYEFYLSPDLIIVGGGVSKKYEKFLPRLKRDAKVIPATLLNEAGIVGAALAAKSLLKSSK